VSFGGKLMGGIRIRAPRNATISAPSNQTQDIGPAPIGDYGDSDVPF
jgi:hypothetical protein